MDLLAAVQTVVANQLKGASLTDLAFGTVTSMSPLTVTVQASRLPISGDALILTDGVVEKKIPSESAVVENGTPLPLKDGYAIINPGLELGDKVVMLRVSAGQRFVVLSRVF